MTYIVGIDPGISGAIAFLDPEAATLRVFDMPTDQFETTKKRTVIDAAGIVDILDAEDISHVYCEKIHSSPQMGVVSAFSFGDGYGVLRGVTAAMRLPWTAVTPASWKKQLRVPVDKRAAVQRASQLFPACAKLFKGPRGGVYDGRAEAALIAFFGALELGRTPTNVVEAA